MFPHSHGVQGRYSIVAQTVSLMIEVLHWNCCVPLVIELDLVILVEGWQWVPILALGSRLHQTHQRDAEGRRKWQRCLD